MKKKIFLGIILVCYGIGLFLVLTLIRVPLTSVVIYTVNSALNGRATFSADHVELGFPDRLRFEGGVIEVPRGSSTIREEVTKAVLQPEYRSLLQGYLPARFSGELSAGRVEGRFGVSRKEGVQDAYLVLHTEGVELSRLETVSSAFGRKVKGILNSELEFQGNLENAMQVQGQGQITISNGAIETRVGFPGLETIPFKRVEVAFSMKDGLVKLDSANMQGSFFTGSLSGTVALRQKLSLSRVSIRGTLSPGREIRQNPFLGRLLGRALQGESTIPIQVKGTLERPSIVREKP